MNLRDKAFKRNPNQNFGPIALVVRLEDAEAAVEEALTLNATCSQCGVALGDSWCADCAGRRGAEREREAIAQIVENHQREIGAFNAITLGALIRARSEAGGTE